MPRIIRQALGERIRQHAGLQNFLGQFREATGVPAEFVSAFGHGECAALCANSPLCARLMRDASGRQLCLRFRQSLLEAAHAEPATLTCDSGVVESAVPMRASGQTVGYLVTGGYLPEPTDRPHLNRARHLLRRSGVNLDEGELLQLSSRTPVVPAARQQALIQLLKLAAEHLTAKITDQLTTVESRMPELVDRACRLVHAEFAQRLSVPDVARRLGVSEGHLSRTFHRATGLRFVEYVARFRAERAKTMLAEEGASVTDTAFACGFQSLSQFNRVFRAQFGLTPSEVRR